MDEFQEHLTTLYSLYNNHSSTVSLLLSYVTSARLFVQEHVLPFVTRLTSKPDLASVALLLILLFISLKVLNLLYQAVMFWVRLVFRLVFWGAIIAGVTWMVTRGPDGMVQDLYSIQQVWKGELGYWQAREQEARYFRHGQPGYQGYGSGNRAYGRRRAWG